MGRRGARVGVVRGDVVDDVLHGQWRLSREQVTAIRRLTTSGAGVDVVVGVAGSGKTTALGLAREAWVQTGHTVIGAALAARAAAQLEEGAGIPSRTLDRLLGELDREPLCANAVIVVDEAAMISTRKLARLLAHATRADAKVVLVGDHRQLPEIGPGGAFRGLADRLDAAELTYNHRQRDPAERDAMNNLRAGKTALAVRKLTQQGRITVGYSSDEIRAQMVADWLAARAEKRDALMLASRRRDVHDLNRAARAALVERGEIRANGIEIDGHVFAVGDSVMALSNRRRLDVTNGDRGVITDVNRARTEVTVQLDRGHTVTLNETYLRAGHLTYAYATTIHKAQGLTCDRALLLADDSIFQEAGYTALTRGCERNQLYVVRSEAVDDNLERSRTRTPDELIDDLTNALSRSRNKRLAIDQTRPQERGLHLPSRSP